MTYIGYGQNGSDLYATDDTGSTPIGLVEKLSETDDITYINNILGHIQQGEY